MLIVVGLGNPGAQYERTRHNIGFDVVNELARRTRVTLNEKRAKSVLGVGSLGGDRLVLVQPQTFMNLSGQAVVGVCQWYKADPKRELLVVFDEVDLPFGTLRLRARGSAGTHNGMRSIVEQLGNQEFARLRVGIGGAPAGWDLVSHVLGRFNQDEAPQIPALIAAAADAVELLAREGLTAAMNRVNAPPGAKGSSA